MKKNIFLIFLIFFLCIRITAESAAEYDVEISSKKSRLHTIRDEIEQKRNKLRELVEEEHGVLAKLENLESEIEITNQYIDTLADMEADLRGEIKGVMGNINELSSSLKKRRKILIKRLSEIYRFGRINEMEVIFGAESFSDIAGRYTHFNKLKQYDMDIINRIQAEKKIKENKEKELSVRLSDIQAVISEKESEKSLLVSQREEKNSILEKVHEQKSEYNIMVRALEREYRKLNKILASLELKRKRAKKADFGDFSRMKGVLQWPVKGGDVIKKYGKNVHPEFRTATFNPGIDIKTTRGHSVRAVFDGSVVYTGHLRGMGNFIILDHGNGYYTMYGNLDKVLVKDKDRIKSGTPVGLAGDSGSFDGVKLHFEIRHKKTTLDPESWLGT